MSCQEALLDLFLRFWKPDSSWQIFLLSWAFLLQLSCSAGMHAFYSAFCWISFVNIASPLLFFFRSSRSSICNVLFVFVSFVTKVYFWIHWGIVYTKNHWFICFTAPYHFTANNSKLYPLTLHILKFVLLLISMNCGIKPNQLSLNFYLDHLWVQN